jgi:hypothetical protein
LAGGAMYVRYVYSRSFSGCKLMVVVFSPEAEKRRRRFRPAGFDNFLRCRFRRREGRIKPAGPDLWLAPSNLYLV